MRALVLTAGAFAALALPANSSAALFLLFDRPEAAPNERVTVRGVGVVTPIRVYLAPRAAIRSRFDRRLAFVGVLRRERLTFSLPPLDSGTYTLAYWCPGCAQYSRGRTFFVQDPDEWVPRSRSRGLLRIRVTESCPINLPNGRRPSGYPRSGLWHGNGLLWTKLSVDGTWSVAPEHVDPDGSIGNKLFYVTTPRLQKPTVSGVRLDAPAPPLIAARANTGSSDHMVPVRFPSAGCWRVTARVADVSLTYVVRVVVR